MFTPGHQQSVLKKHLTICLLFVLFIDFMIGGIVLPAREAKATMDGGDMMANITQTVKDAAAKAKDWVYAEWTKIQSTIQTGYQGTMVALGISEEVQDKIETALDWAWNTLRKTLLNMLVDDIVRWIQGGGKPRVITDWQSFLKTAADKAGGQFIEQYLKMGFLCSSFRSSLRILLAAPPTFDQAATCTISKVISNIENFFDDFSQGGWKAWITISETQNNLYGAYLYGLDQKWGIEAEAAKASQNEGVASAGFLGDKICREIRQVGDKSGDSNLVENYTDNEKDNGQFGGWKQDEIPEGFECAKWETRTPGKIVADAISKSVTVDIDWLINADEFNEYLSAIATAVVNRVIKEGVTAMQTSGGSTARTGSGISSSPMITANIGSYAEAAQADGTIPELLSQERLYKENLQKNLDEQKTNLNLLNQVKTAQESAFAVLTEMLSSGCSVPAGTSQSDMGTQFSGTCNSAHSNCPCSEISTQSTKVTSPTLGEAILKKITETKYTGDSFFCSVSSTQTSFSASVQSSSATAEIEKTNAAIANTNSLITKTDTAINDLLDYQKEVGAYKQAYTVAQNKGSDVSNVSGTAMNTAKQKVLASTQALTDSPTQDLTALISELVVANQNLAQKTSTVAQQRGPIDSCQILLSYSAGGYYQWLCNAQKAQSDWQTSYNACLPPIGF